LLVNIKSARNVVPVPTHWSLKREYLSSKRGIEKPGFALPKFIAETGISEMRDAVLEKQAEATLKQKARERVSGKTGKLDIDYQKLYEAFFRRQTKPSLTRYGEVYYEGKEFETNLRHLRPGELSEELKEALNMPPGAPPPWLINQQKVGVPPSYPALKIPGLNAPPPPGAQWGFHPGGYGKPPVDDQNRPLFGGDVFGLSDLKEDKQKEQGVEEPVDKSLWGELQPPQEEEEEEEEEDEDVDSDEETGEADFARTGMETPYGGTETPGGFTSTVPTDFPRGADDVNLRKQRYGTETETSNHPRAAGTVLNERSIRAEGFFGGERAYDLSGGNGPPSNVRVLGQEQRGSKRKVGDVDVSVDMEALVRDGKLSKEEMQKAYEAQRAEQSGWQGGAGSEDLSGLVAEETAKRQKRDRERAQKGRR
jgi:splicing factor 3B subunit 2